MEGDPDRPVIVGTSAKLKPGHLIKGEVTEIVREGDPEIDPQTGAESCSLRLGENMIVQTFGDLVTEGPLDVLFDDEACFRNDASSKEDLFQLFESLAEDEYIDLKIKGIGSGEPDEIVAHELKVKVRSRHGNDD